MDIRHVVVLMLENRSFDCMLGMLHPSGPGFDGLRGTESNPWHRPGEPPRQVRVWASPALTPQALRVPDPDPGEAFTDIAQQIHGRPGAPAMSGFVDNYMAQPASTPAADPAAVMHYFTPDQLPALSGLARAFGVSDRWHASAPCQTWPNRFFAHTGTANGRVNNSPTHFPYVMETVFDRLAGAGRDWRIYFHDIPQAATLARLWNDVFTRFRRFEAEFARDAAAGTLPAYSFIEPRYFTDQAARKVPNDQHPPHDVAEGEALIAGVYNALRSGPGWRNTLLIVTYDEHGGCYDHVMPPAATPPGGPAPDGFAFDRFGVRVPALIVSPYVRPGSVLRPRGPTPFDHTSIIATLRALFGFAPLTARDAAAPDLLGLLDPAPLNDGPASIAPRPVAPAPAEVAQLASRPPNDLQRSLCTAAVQLPTAGADIAAHVRRLGSVTDAAASHPTVAAAEADVAAHMRAFLGGG